MLKKCLLLLLLSQFHIVFSQQNKNIDSLINVYKTQPKSIERCKTLQELYWLLKESNPEQALKYLKESLNDSQKLGYDIGEAYALNKLGFYYKNYRNLDSSRYYFKKAENINIKLKDKEGLFNVLQGWNRLENLEGNFKIALQLSNKAINAAKELNDGIALSDSYQQRSTIYLDKGDYKNAYEELINASRSLDTLKNKNPLKQAIIKIGIGRTETLRNNYEEALPYLIDGVKTFEKLNHSKWLAISYMELGNTYYDLKNYDDALLYYNKGLKISTAMKWNHFIAPYMANIGAIYLDKKDYDKALTYFLDSNKISSKHGSINNKIIHLNDVASAYMGKKEFTKAINYYTQTIQLADSIGSIDNLSDAYFERSEAYESIKNYKQALKDYKNYSKYKDSTFNATKFKQIEVLKTIYETEKKEQKIILQDKEIDLLKQKEKNNNLQRLLLAIGLMLSLVGFYAIRQKLKRKKVEKEKLDSELEFKKKELTTHALHLARKNEVLESLKTQAQQLKVQDENKKGYQQLIRAINFDLQDDKNWENFSQYFEEVHQGFSNKAKQEFPEITSNDLRLMALIKMNLSSKEVANILSISGEGIKKARYRLRKKLNLSTQDSLEDFILRFV